jgi:thioredoxin reductase (NADPH)
VHNWDSLIVGGGIAGLQAAIQLGRYGHRVLVIDAGYGRSTICRSYHNILGWPDGISGEQLRSLGRKQAESVGVKFILDEVIEAKVNADDKADGGTHAEFELTGKSGARYQGQTLLLATGIMDRFPVLPGLVACFGLTVYVCPDCDGYEIKDKPTIVMGAGDAGAEMALILSDFSRDIVYVNHESKPVKLETQDKLRQMQIRHMQEAIVEVLTEAEGQFTGVKLANGEVLQARRGFIAFGGNTVHSELARQLGVERLENRHLLADPRTKMTNIRHVWVAGDVGVHAEQVTIAMGEGAQSAIWMHKALQQMQLNQNPYDAIHRPEYLDPGRKNAAH